jgi:hypothetical protein
MILMRSSLHFLHSRPCSSRDDEAKKAAENDRERGTRAASNRHRTARSPLPGIGILNWRHGLPGISQLPLIDTPTRYRMNDTNLHVYYLERNLSGFRKYLEGAEPLPDAPTGLAYSRSYGGPSSSGPRSWTISNLALKKPDPNSRDAFGRTVLHLVCSASPTSPIYARSFDFLATLLAHPHINVNATDSESGYTPLHRAMWSGNLRAARALLERADTDLSIKDAEGLTAMDLYNSSCAGTNPPDSGAKGTDLYTWGSNSELLGYTAQGLSICSPRFQGTAHWVYQIRQTELYQNESIC